MLSQLSIYPADQKTVQIGTLKNSSLNSTLHYLNGNCMWTITIRLEDLELDDVREGPQILLRSAAIINEYDIKCEVNNSVRLHAEISILGELIYESRN